MLHLGYACLISGLCWAIVGYVSIMLGHFGVFCRLCWPLLGKSWDDHIGLILGHVWACAWNVVFARYFSGVAVAFEWYFWWCMGGLLLVVAWHVVSSQNMDRYFNGVLHLHAQTQYTSIHTIKQSCTCGPWHLQRFSCPDRRSLDKEKAACVACDKVNKCKSHPKIMKDSQNDFAFSRESVIFPARFLFDCMVEDFMRILPHLLAAGKPKCKLHLQYIEGCNYRACSACSISSLSFVVLALLYWFNADIWVMCGHVLLVSFGSGFLL